MRCVLNGVTLLKINVFTKKTNQKVILGNNVVINLITKPSFSIEDINSLKFEGELDYLLRNCDKTKTIVKATVLFLRNGEISKKLIDEYNSKHE